MLRQKLPPHIHAKPQSAIIQPHHKATAPCILRASIDDPVRLFGILVVDVGSVEVKLAEARDLELLELRLR